VVAASFTDPATGIRTATVRLEEDGSIDPGFTDAQFDGSSGPRVLAIQNDDKVVLAGTFGFVNGIHRKNIARLHADGTLDLEFARNPVVDASIDSLAIQGDGKIVVAGDFGYSIARLNSDGTRDGSFVVTNSAAAWVDAVAVDSLGKVIIGGTFERVGSATRGYIARLNPDGSLDTGFGNGLAGASSYVCCVAAQKDNKVLLGGYFTRVNGAVRNHIARLSADGSVDTTFGEGMTGADGYVLALLVLPDGKVLAGGRFNSINGVHRPRIARLHADGSVDTSFAANSIAAPNEVWSDVLSLATGLDERIYIGGAFAAVNQLGRRYLARLHGDRPPLTLRRRSIDEILLSWPSGWTGFAAQHSQLPGSSWADLAQPPVNDGTNWTVVLPPTNFAGFFRLKKQEGSEQ
jgi:uncharacterized delta-60 repeat protein